VPAAASQLQQVHGLALTDPCCLRATVQVEAQSSALEGCLLYFVNYGEYK
jgi:hypothetical protein